MSNIPDNLAIIKAQIPQHVQLVAVSKFHNQSVIEEAYQAGQRIFGESKAQEVKQKYELLPKDIQWHFIGHLQTNKVKYIAPFIALIHSIDSYKLLEEVNKQAVKNDRIIPCLLQIHIAEEESKFGFDFNECREMLSSEQFLKLKNIDIQGLMGMATFTEDDKQVRKEFKQLHDFFQDLQHTFFSDNNHFQILSMGMSDDFPIAIEEGSTMVRVGSSIFGNRK